jgi:hypothetical protein
MILTFCTLLLSLCQLRRLMSWLSAGDSCLAWKQLLLLAAGNPHQQQQQQRL